MKQISRKPRTDSAPPPLLAAGQYQRIKNVVRAALPRVFWHIRSAKYKLAVARGFRGIYRRECNLCGYRGYFSATGWPPRFDAECKRCRSIDRHRLMHLWLEANRARLQAAAVLHFAPETSLAKYIRTSAASYLSADIVPGRGDLCLDIEAIGLPDESVDLILCSHVLDYVSERSSLSELRRVLRADGLLLMMLTVIEGWDHTYENPSLRSATERSLHFGLPARKRLYGNDIRARIAGAGFELSEFVAGVSDVQRYGLRGGEKIFVAKKIRC